MPALTRNVAKNIVTDSLRRIADFNGDVEGYTFRRFGVFHKEVFLAALKAGVIVTARDENNHYDVDLTPDSFDQWPTVGDCITWVFDEAYTKRRQTERLRQADLEA